MSRKAAPQLLLGLGFRKEFTFDNFVSVSSSDVVARLRSAVFDSQEAFVYLAGGSGSGKTHLSIALLNAALDNGKNAYYLSARDILSVAAGNELGSYFEYFQDYDLLVLDDIDAFASNPACEQALFNLYNHYRDLKQQLVVSARVVPIHSEFKLPDLRSRLGAGLIINVDALSDEDKKSALVSRARERGMTLNSEVLNYIFSRSSRSLGALLEVLDKLDHAQLVEKRSLTVPFVKKVLDW
ncbi:hypothetical protein A3742_27265 [Oleiphilus sp. HI0071]|uniref:DnaA regulatory inactivator Hda n=2 Tax=Oleiphilus TaxID=141450 RepID=UPI0007C3158B|nr:MULTISPECIES: DnaA regulatory inactivator Hda [unclassified Oleiphilus]KZY70139.1 hypothetical protein A3737_12215 [Oleiphilus sp. HI0065]KZY83393.1 hypothetical protein A3742_07310 [Oleiphilus sp. HI0071]KZY91063.1 hypothetical protein A3744_04105 [Oleiphilus sp. HI0073]KZZ42086.1 hypothetical protein A3758_05755 [Oleiphilus sp. HI0118]KZZ60466.1 hypothetical protein A3760_06320 [Oleiphilus sp. HI0122]KZZ64680.1 hypothetical protein A3765_06745 [Oleiphilus sp. HI0130]KZZ81889.1 hypotheti